MKSKAFNKILHKAPKINSEPLWKGPYINEDGITFSMLSKFLNCRERFRILVIDGIKPKHQFNHKIEYGNMWHICEESYAQKDNWLEKLKDYVDELSNKYMTERNIIDHWYNVCKTQFKIYIDIWDHREKVEGYQSLFEEAVFSVGYHLPSGRVVRLRGKFDKIMSVSPSSSSNKRILTLQENKTKGDINIQQIIKQLSFDLQTMLYIVCLDKHLDNVNFDINKFTNKQVLYNVVKRPLSGGRGTIVRHKATKNKPGESKGEFYLRLGEIIKNNQSDFFSRIKVSIYDNDIVLFKETCLDPVLEQLCDWWDCLNGGEPSKFSKYYQNYRYPYGVYNVLNEGGSTELDSYLLNKSMIGLERVTNLFPEL